MHHFFGNLRRKGVGVSCLILSLGIVSCADTATKATEPNRALTVTELKLQSVSMYKDYVADIQGVQYVEIKSMVEGFVEKIYVDEGQKVYKGDTLFKLTSEHFAEDVRLSEAALRQAEAELKMAEYESSRVSRLVEKEILSPIRLEQANAEKEVASLKVEQALAQYQRAQVNYEYTIIRAPYNGYIGRTPYKKGSMVQPGSLLTTISDISEIFAYYKMNEADYLKYKRAQLEGDEENVEQMDSVQLILPDGSLYEYMGNVEAVQGTFERGTGSIAFRVRFPNPDRLLKHGVTGKVLVTSRVDGVYLIPQQSTFEIQEFTYVYVVDKDDKARIRSFKPLGRYKGFYVAQDFEPETKIVFDGVRTVKDGMKLKYIEESFNDIVKEMDTYINF